MTKCARRSENEPGLRIGLMANLSIPKKAAVIAVIIVVIMIPAFLAFNDQGVKDAFGANGSQSNLDAYLDGHAKYYETATTTEAGRVVNGVHEFKTIPVPTPQSGSEDVIESVKLISTPKPIPTITPKWAPEFPATDGEVLINGLVEEDSVNVLIIGVDRTAYLFDTIGVVSISREKQTVKLIMFSRDLYIGYSENVLENIAKIRHNKLPGEYKFNNTYNVAKNTEKYAEGVVYNDNRFENHAFDFLAQVVYEKFDILVDDFVRINTYGLIRLVDLFGGVRVYVPVYMRYNDPDQNLNINISKGTQWLNGTQAEGFVRFRQGYDGKGRLSITADRTQNQIAFMKAFYEQHAKISNINKIPEILDTLKRNVIHSISATDLFSTYIDILTAVVDDGYEFQTVNFKLKDKRINGSNYYIIERLLEEGEEN